MKPVIIEFEREEIDLLIDSLLLIASDALKNKEPDHIRSIGFLLQKIGSQIKNTWINFIKPFAEKHHKGRMLFFLFENRIKPFFLFHHSLLTETGDHKRASPRYTPNEWNQTVLLHVFLFENGYSLTGKNSLSKQWLFQLNFVFCIVFSMLAIPVREKYSVVNPFQSLFCTPSGRHKESWTKGHPLHAFGRVYFNVWYIGS